jgi:hypothetical protein
MKLKVVLFTLLIGFLSELNAQLPDYSLNDPENYRPNYGLQGSFWNNSGNIPASVFHHIAGIGNTSNISAEQAAKGGASFFGVHAGWKTYANVYLNEKSKQSKYLSHFSIEQHFFASGNLENDASALLFKGNKQFENQMADASGSGLFSMQFQSAKVGFSKQKENYTYGFNIGLAAGRSFNKAKINTFQLFTAPFGEYLDANLQYSIQSNTSPLYYNGVGAFMDFTYQRKLNEQSVIHFQLNNFGLMRWSNNSLNQTADTSFRFQGIVINDIFNFDGANIQLGDTLNRLLGISDEQQSAIHLLPFHLALQYDRNLNDRLLIRGAITYFHHLHILPWLRLGTMYQLNQQFALQAGLQYGGAGNFNSDFGVRYSSGKVQLSLHSLINEAWLNPQRAAGSGLMFKFIIFTGQ